MARLRQAVTSAFQGEEAARNAASWLLPQRATLTRMVDFRENARAASSGKSGKTMVGRFQQVNPTVQVFRRKPKPDAAAPPAPEPKAPEPPAAPAPSPLAGHPRLSLKGRS